jgi:signal transduction histidine kinase
MLIARQWNPRHAALASVGMLVLAAIGQWVSALLWTSGVGTHIVWFPGAMLLGALMVCHRWLWPLLMVSALAGIVGACASLGLPPVDTALVAASPVLLSPVAAWLLTRHEPSTTLVDDFRRLGAFAGIAVGALPVASAWMVDHVSRLTALRSDVLSDWLNIALSHALGYVLWVPAWIALLNADSALRHRQRWSPTIKLALVLSIVALGYVWYTFGSLPELSPALCILPAPIVLVGIVRAQMAGSSVLIFAIAVMAAHLSVAGFGPFLADSQRETALSVQLWTLLSALSAAALSVLAEQRERALRDLGDAHRQLRSLAGRLIATQEEERARLARDLHDDVSQRLAATAIGLSALRRHVAAERRDDVARVQNLIVSLSNDIRLMSHTLHPSAMKHAGLRAALDTLCQQHAALPSPRITLSVDHAVDDLPADVSLCFYRVAQEALANAIRHADASMVTIKAFVAEGQAVLRVFDNGKGYAQDTEGSAERAGLGLISIHERARLLGGWVEWRSAPGEGVDLCVRIPMATT